MSEPVDGPAAARRLIEAEDALRRVIRAGEELQRSSEHLSQARTDMAEATRAMKDLLTGIEGLAQDALKAVQAVRALNPADLFARIENTHRRMLRAVWLATGLVIVVLLAAVLLLRA